MKMINRQEYIKFDMSQYRERIISINGEIAKLKVKKKNLQRKLMAAEERLTG